MDALNRCVIGIATLSSAELDARTDSASPKSERRDRSFVEAGNVEVQSSVLVVHPSAAIALRNGGPVHCRGNRRRAAAGQVPGERSVRIPVSLRDHVRVLVWWRRPGPARDRAFHFGFRLFFLPPMYSIAVAFKDIPRLLLFAITAAVRDCVERGAKERSKSLRAHARRPADGGRANWKMLTRRCKSRMPNEGGPSRPFVRPSESFN